MLKFSDFQITFMLKAPEMHTEGGTGVNTPPDICKGVYSLID
jgi:hypothetical protein